MSAAEKLKALDEAMIPAPWETKRWPHRATELIGPADPERSGYRLLTRPAKDLAFVAVLRNALPQIVAVVEAAEQAGPEPALIRPLRAALAALDAVLTK